MNPALNSFLASFEAESILAQVLIRRVGTAYDLRHIADREASAEAIELVAVAALRALAQFTAADAFRPLKTAPNLRRGWRVLAENETVLELALNHLYPGAIADWFAARSCPPPVTSYRQFTARQSGMYRITTMLSDEAAASVIRACCHIDSCLKRRLWSVEGLAPDAPDQKSIIPCLEPCAIMLETARKEARLEQEQNRTPPATATQP
jgi:hypothetical protein